MFFFFAFAKWVRIEAVRGRYAIVQGGSTRKVSQCSGEAVCRRYPNALVRQYAEGASMPWYLFTEGVGLVECGRCIHARVFIP